MKTIIFGLLVSMNSIISACFWAEFDVFWV